MTNLSYVERVETSQNLDSKENTESKKEQNLDSVIFRHSQGLPKF